MSISERPIEQLSDVRPEEVADLLQHECRHWVDLRALVWKAVQHADDIVDSKD